MNNKTLSIITLLAVLTGLPALSMSSETSSIERYVETHRFVSNGNAHYDKFTNQYLLLLPTDFTNRKEAIQACEESSATINKKSPEWRLASTQSVLEICENISQYRGLSRLQSDGNLLVSKIAFTSGRSLVVSINNCSIEFADIDKNGNLLSKLPGNGKLNALCVANEIYGNDIIYNRSKKLAKKIRINKRALIEERHAELFAAAKKTNSLDAYNEFISSADKKSKFVKMANQQISQLKATSDFKNLSSSDNLATYVSHITKYPNSLERDSIEHKIIEIVKVKRNISGLEWFVNTYPNSRYIADAIPEIHKLAYAQAKKINTLSAYNTYIIAYPYSGFTEQALSSSRQLEEDKYDVIDEDEERKARLLAVKIKKMTINVNKAKSKAGYELVINRMSELLTNKYEATDASLRYYESKEFTDFASRFDQTMLDIKHVLSNIEDNTDGLMAAVKESFASADADRDMAAYKLQQHEEWEKNMHLRDKGYN